MGFGRYYEEFEVGAVYKHWPGRTITEHDNTWFALLSMNQHPLFIDQNFAGRCPVVDGLIFSIAVGMSVGDTSGKTIANLGYEIVRFEQPLFPGDSCMPSPRFWICGNRIADPIAGSYILRRAGSTRRASA